MKKNWVRKKILWIYDDRDHLTNPILIQATNTLLSKRCSVYLIDNATCETQSKYTHIPLKKHGIIVNLIRSAIKRINEGNNTFGNIRTVGNQQSTITSLYSLFIFLKTLTVSLWIHPKIIIFSKPTSGAVVALLAAKLFSARLVYYPFELFGEQHFIVSEHWKKFETFLLKNFIEALITQNVLRAKEYREIRRSRVIPTVVHNYKPFTKVNQKGALRKILKLNRKIKIVLYEGHFIQGRWLLNLIKSVQYFPKNTVLVLIGKGADWWKENALPLLNNPHISKKVIILPWMRNQKLYATIPDADVGVIIYDNKKKNNLYCEPGKLSDYILCGIPVVVPNFPTIAPIVKRYKIGEIFFSPKPSVIAKAVNNILVKSKKKWRNNLIYAQKELIWEKQETKLLSVLLDE